MERQKDFTSLDITDWDWYTESTNFNIKLKYSNNNLSL
jgi:hypothetical protein